MRGVLIGILVFLAVILLFFGGILLAGKLTISNYQYDAPEQVVLPEGTEVITAVGKGLYDVDGKRFDIKGINFGNLFIAEGWMTINSVGASKNEDGTYVKVNDQGVVEEYEEIYQEEMDAIFADRFTDEEIEALNDAFFDSYCTEADFKLISDLGMNTIRIPVYYRTFLTTYDRYRLSDEELCAMDFDSIELDFSKLDTFIEYASKYDLKVIIDMHGVMGGQSGFEHCGTRDIEFWDNEEYIQFMCKLWQAIAKHYTLERADLSYAVLAYDLVNEPTNRNEIGTGPKQWKVMDRLYNAIREVDDKHVISIEGVWFPVSLPSPDKYDWENVLYQFHYYNWDWQGTSNELYYSFICGLSSLVDYDVPKLVGEFNFFGNSEAWDEYLKLYDKMGWGWTIWSYKIISVGWWDNSWGIVVNKLDLWNDNIYDIPEEERKLKLDLSTASYEEILGAWSSQQTEYDGQTGVYKIYKDSITYNALVKYFEELSK